MELTYENIKNFLYKYFEYYNKYSQKAETIHKMDECWAEEFVAAAHFARQDGGKTPIKYIGGKTFAQVILNVHQKIGEKLIPENIVIDMEKKQGAVQLKIEKEVHATGEKVYFTGAAIYSVGLDKDKNLKLYTLDIWVDNPNKLTGMWYYE